MDISPRLQAFEETLPSEFHVPCRLMGVSAELVESVNRFHFAMMNDKPRNHFYFNLLKKHIERGKSGVLEIGSGSGLLAMMASQLGAKWVVSVESSSEMYNIALENLKENGFNVVMQQRHDDDDSSSRNTSDDDRGRKNNSDEESSPRSRIILLNKLSTDLELTDLPGSPDILVSEIFGTLLLGEGALRYIADVRDRFFPSTSMSTSATGSSCSSLLPHYSSPSCIPIVTPRFGVQYSVIIECPALEELCSVVAPASGKKEEASPSWKSLNLTHLNYFKDTASCLFTKKFGFLLNSVQYTELCDPFVVTSVDFALDGRTSSASKPFPPPPGFELSTKQTVQVTGKKSGTAHAMMLFWKVFDEVNTQKLNQSTMGSFDQGDISTNEGRSNTEFDLCISTHPRDTKNNFPRDMQWGQALQLLQEVEVEEQDKVPRSVEITQGELRTIEIMTSSGEDHSFFQFQVLPVGS